MEGFSGHGLTEIMQGGISPYGIRFAHNLEMLDVLFVRVLG